MANRHDTGDTGQFGLSERTRVKLHLGTAWGIIASIVATTVWLTVLILKTYMTNQVEHLKLMDGLTRLNALSAEWVTREKMIDASVWMAAELHAGSKTNQYDYAFERALRDGMRKVLRQPRQYDPYEPFP